MVPVVPDSEGGIVMSRKPLFVIGVCAIAVAGSGAGSAVAGEVKGPPGSAATAVPGGNTNETGAVGTAASACAANGLNDFDTIEGQNDFIVQSYGIDVSGLAPSEPADPHVFNPGDPAACRGVPSG
jgi:hypothetical protein